MHRKWHNITVLALALVLLASCGNDDDSSDKPDSPVGPSLESKIPLNVMALADDGEMSTIVDAGLYMQHYVDGKKSELIADANYLNNLKLTYTSGHWQFADPAFWYDDASLSDLYVYVPYQQSVPDSRKVGLKVPTDQNNSENLALADFMWGQCLAVAPTDKNIDVKLSHRLSRVKIKVMPDDSFKEGELKPADVTVYVKSVQCDGTFDLQTGELSVTGNKQSICAHNNGDFTFSAIVMPQSLGFVNMLQIDCNNGASYTIQDSFVYEPQKSCLISVTINKKQVTGLNVDIGGWDIDDKDYGGTVQ